MTFSYTQVSQYLRCPRSYRFRYLDGWREKDSRAALCFGRCFEKAIAALFEREDAGAVLFKEWGAYREVPLEYSHGDDWERLLRQGIGLLEQFARDNRIRIRQPKQNMQKKIVRSLSSGNEFVAYVDAIGHLDGTRRLLEWKTTSARYPDQPEGLTSLDLQLVCYSWITGISDVAIVAFVRKRVPERSAFLQIVMLGFRKHGVLEERAGTLTIGIAGNNQHSLAGANVTNCLAGLGKIGQGLAAFEVLFQVGIADVGLASGRKRKDDAENNEAAALAGIEYAGAIGEAAGFAAQLAHLAVFAIEDFDRLDGLGNFLPVGANVLHAIPPTLPECR